MIEVMGKNLFSGRYALKNPEKDDRERIIQWLLKNEDKLKGVDGS